MKNKKDKKNVKRLWWRYLLFVLLGFLFAVILVLFYIKTNCSIHLDQHLCDQDCPRTFSLGCSLGEDLLGIRYLKGFIY